MTYEFQIGERVTVTSRAPWAAWPGPAMPSNGVVTTLRAGDSGNHPTRSARVRVKLDAWPRPLWFAKRDVNPL